MYFTLVQLIDSASNVSVREVKNLYSKKVKIYDEMAFYH